MAKSKPVTEMTGHPTSKRHRLSRLRRLLLRSLTDGVCIAQTKRQLNFNLQALVEEQLRLFYTPLFETVPGRVRLERMLEECLFEIKESVSRLSDHAYSHLADEKKRQATMINDPIAIQIQAAQVLGVPVAASRGDLKKAYLAKARESHPDRAGGSNDRMQQVNIAYAVLLEALDDSDSESHREVRE